MFQGYLIKATVTGTIFPHEYIVYDTYDTTPNQREELKAYRDDNTRNLTRVTAAGKKSVIAFKTRDNLHLSDLQALKEFFSANESDASQRKINLEYWDMENLEYKTGDFYRPNMKYTIRKITDNDIIIKEMQIDFIEY